MNALSVPRAAGGLRAARAWCSAIGIRHSPDKGIIASPLLGKPAPQFALPELLDPARDRALAGFARATGICSTCGAPGAVSVAPSTRCCCRSSSRTPCRIIGLDWKDDDAQAQAWLTQLGNPYETVAVDRSGRAAIDWGVYGAPETFLVNPTGIVVYKHVGALTEEVWTREILPRVQGGKS